MYSFFEDAINSRICTHDAGEICYADSDCCGATLPNPVNWCTRGICAPINPRATTTSDPSLVTGTTQDPSTTQDLSTTQDPSAQTTLEVTSEAPVTDASTGTVQDTSSFSTDVSTDGPTTESTTSSVDVTATGFLVEIITRGTTIIPSVIETSGAPSSSKVGTTASPSSTTADVGSVVNVDSKSSPVTVPSTDNSLALGLGIGLGLLALIIVVIAIVIHRRKTSSTSSSKAMTLNTANVGVPQPIATPAIKSMEGGN
jgi:hypothetical protein